VIALADTIDAMTTDRPYREALDSDAVRLEIASQAGKQFDPIICESLLAPSYWSEMVLSISLNNSRPLTSSSDGPASRPSVPSLAVS
jgi:HD-GYP domain-containing protein (c-di-GMP phosphodiesterase class II)